MAPLRRIPAEFEAFKRLHLSYSALFNRQNWFCPRLRKIGFSIFPRSFTVRTDEIAYVVAAENMNFIGSDEKNRRYFFVRCFRKTGEVGFMKDRLFKTSMSARYALVRAITKGEL